MSRLLEICVDDIAGLEAAVAGGADRIELCSALALGGLTPSGAFVSRAVATGVPIHAMIRPRMGDFTYSPDERAVMADDIARFADLGVAGFVTGAALLDGRLDRAALASFRAAAPSCNAVVHRVIDLTPDPCAAIRDAHDVGYEFVLSSGGEKNAVDGAARLAQMVAAAAGRLTVIAGAGVTPGNVAALVRATGVVQVHGSASDATDWTDPRILSFGFATTARRGATVARVAAMRAALMRD